MAVGSGGGCGHGSSDGSDGTLVPLVMEEAVLVELVVVVVLRR